MGEEEEEGSGVEQSGEQVEVVAVRWRRGGKGGERGTVYAWRAYKPSSHGASQRTAAGEAFAAAL